MRGDRQCCSLQHSQLCSARPKDTGFIVSASDLVVQIPIAVWRDMAI